MLATVGKFAVSNLLPSALAGIGSAAATNIIDKISGKDTVYVKQKGMGCAITPTVGNGLYLSPWKSTRGDGLYMKTGTGKYVSEDGILLEPNSPFKDVPFLGMLL